ncbi:aminoglycoside adenylyltransferase domain-containing protein [Methylobacterium sp.]|uniref:aminoglycoside adenylyltransferase domain-containing protein n=1 Tax=Methylobacterium sp. TaxID=409 RepID=UPI003B01CB72
MTAHPLALRGADTYLAAVDGAAPGLVEALYLVGSAALDDFRPGLSDLDFVAVMAPRAGDGHLTSLAEVHARLDENEGVPTLDGLYATWDELRAGPLARTAGPCVERGRFVRSGRRSRDPMTWCVMRDAAVTVRGPLCAGTGAWRDPGGLDRWLAASVDRHWRPWLSQALSALHRGEPSLLDDDDVEGVVLGLCRLHYALATGQVPSKSGAGLYGLIAFPARWRPLVDEALRIRREPGATPRYPDARRRRDDVLAFAGFALADADALEADARARRRRNHPTGTPVEPDDGP